MRTPMIFLILAACGQAPELRYIKKVAKEEPKTIEALVEREARVFGLKPEFLAEMLRIESSLDSKAVSHKGAEGIAQLMPETSKKLGVDPYDPEEAIMGAAYWLNVGRRELAKHGFPTTRKWLAKWYNCGLPNLKKNKSCGDHHASKFKTL